MTLAKFKYDEAYRTVVEMSEYEMTYIGKGLYSKAQFVAEADKHGVARALPVAQVRGLEWGDPILLAQWLPDTAAQRASMTRQISLVDDAPFSEQTRGVLGLRFKRFGAAEVFGYFCVTGLNMTGLPEMKDELVKALDVIETVFHGAGGQHVSRRCGSYGVESTSYVNDTIAQILEKAAPIEEKYGVRFKWFVCGRFEPLAEFSLDPARFSRGLVSAEIDADPALLFERSLPEGDDARAKVNFILDYKRRSYVRKNEGES